MTRDRRPVFSFGVVGGDFQPQGQSQVLMNLLDFGMSVQQAGDQPRVSHDDSSTPTGKKMVGSGTVTLEPRIPDSVRQELVEMGHKVRPGVNHFGSFQGIWRKDEPLRYFGGSDPRMDGWRDGILTRERWARKSERFMADDDLEVYIASGLDPATAIVLADDRPPQPRKPLKLGCAIAVAALVAVVWWLLR